MKTLTDKDRLERERLLQANLRASERANEVAKKMQADMLERTKKKADDKN